jgi:hypothetical protein
VSERRRQFAAAFHAQARSDWEVYELLSRVPSGLPKCHELHYLQMACEKLSKAYRLRQPAANVDEIATHHVGFLKFINDYVRSPAMKARYAGKASAHKAMCKEAGKIAREIEKLAPAVDRAWSPENAEYPWERGNWDEGNGTVLVPCSYPYPSLSLLRTPGGRSFIKLVDQALRDWKPAP